MNSPYSLHTFLTLINSENLIALQELSRFSWLSRTWSLFPGFSSPGKCQNKIPGLSRFFGTHTNPEYTRAFMPLCHILLHSCRVKSSLFRKGRPFSTKLVSAGGLPDSKLGIVQRLVPMHCKETFLFIAPPFLHLPLLQKIYSMVMLNCIHRESDIWH